MIRIMLFLYRVSKKTEFWQIEHRQILWVIGGKYLWYLWQIHMYSNILHCQESLVPYVKLGPWAYWVCKGALKNKRSHKNKWFFNIILTGIYPTSLDWTGSVGFVTKNHKYFSPTTSRIRRCSICQNSVFLDTLYVGAIPDICQFW